MEYKRNKITENALIGITVLLILLVVGLYFYRFNGELTFDHAVFGMFGDYVGGVISSIVSCLSIIFIYKTYKSQLQFSAEQQYLSLLQAFETSFFNLLMQQHEIVMSLRGTDDHGNSLCGYDYLNSIAKELKLRLSSREYGLEEITDENIEIERELIDEQYTILYRKYSDGIGHYFRSLYHILVYVNDSEIKNKQRYFKIIQAQLSNNELYLMFYNSISHFGKDKMYPLVAHNQMLENLRYSGFDYFGKHQKIFYPQTNFKQ